MPARRRSERKSSAIQGRYNILDFSDATDFSPIERELLINSGVLIGAAFTNHQVLIAGFTSGRYSVT